MRIVLALLLSGCAATPIAEPHEEPTCGFIRQWVHCCVMKQGPNLLVSCKELQEPAPEAPDSNPRREL